jgi:NADH-ubiquinone oxidoreductase chain 5
LFNKPTSVSA